LPQSASLDSITASGSTQRRRDHGGTAGSSERGPGQPLGFPPIARSLRTTCFTVSRQNFHPLDTFTHCSRFTAGWGCPRTMQLVASAADPGTRLPGTAFDRNRRGSPRAFVTTRRRSDISLLTLGVGFRSRNKSLLSVVLQSEHRALKFEVCPESKVESLSSGRGFMGASSIPNLSLWFRHYIVVDLAKGFSRSSQ